MKKLSEVEGKCNANVAFKFITVAQKLKYIVDLKLNEPEIFSPQIERTIVLNVISVEQLDCAQSIQNNFELKSVLYRCFIIKDLSSLVNSANGQVGDKKFGLFHVRSLYKLRWNVLLCGFCVVSLIKGHKRERRSARLTKIEHRATHLLGRHAKLSLFVRGELASLRENCLPDHSYSSAL